MKYYLYRIKKEDYEKLKGLNNIKIDYTPEQINEDDKIIVFVSESLKILGSYKKREDYLVAEKLAKNELTLKDFYEKLSIITEVGQRTYKVFAKKVKEISEEDYNMIMKKITNQ